MELHPEKTRLIQFGRFAAQDRKRRGQGKPETFTFLGFVHYCGKRRKDGAFIVWRETAKKRLVAKLKEIKAELKRRRAAAGFLPRPAGTLLPDGTVLIAQTPHRSSACWTAKSHAII